MTMNDLPAPPSPFTLVPEVKVHQSFSSWTKGVIKEAWKTSLDVMSCISSSQDVTR